MPGKHVRSVGPAVGQLHPHVLRLPVGVRPVQLDEPDDVVTREVIAAGARMIDGLTAAVVGSHVVRWKHAVPEATPAAVPGVEAQLR